MIIPPSDLWIFGKQISDLTDISCNIRVQPRENNGAVGKVFRNALLYDEGAGHCRNRRGLFPVHRLAIKFPGRSGGGTEGVDDEPGVVGEQRDESLANCASRSEDANLNGWCAVRGVVGGGGGHFRGGEVGGR